MFNLNKTQTHENGQGLTNSAKQLPNGTTERNSLMNCSNEDYNPPLFKFKNKPSRAWLFMIAIGLLIFLKPEVGKGQSCTSITGEDNISSLIDLTNITSSGGNIQKNLYITNDLVLNNWILNFSSNVQIKVKYGKKLTLTNCNFSSCDLNWEGIKVEGDKTESNQTLQGSIELVNTKISNAKYGIQTINTSGTPEGGALIEATNSEFENCLISIQMNEYEFETSSYFLGCTFETNSVSTEYEDPNHVGDYIPIDCHIDLNKVNGLKIFDCEIKNEIVGNTGNLMHNGNNFARGKGIHAKSSRFELLGKFDCPAIPVGCNKCIDNCNGTNSIIKGLFYGIYIETFDPAEIQENTIIGETDFINNHNAIYCLEEKGTGIFDNLLIIDNQFDNYVLTTSPADVKINYITMDQSYDFTIAQ